MRPVASPLFQGLSAEEWAALEQSGCLRTKSYPRHAVIFHAGEQVHALGVVLRGTSTSKISTCGAVRAS